MTRHSEHVLERLNAYLDQTLAREDAATVRRHLAQCSSCSVAVEKIKRQRDVDPWQAENRWAGQGMSRGLTFSQLFFAGLAVVAIVLFVVHVYYLALKPSPYDLQVLGQAQWLPGSEAAVHLRVASHSKGAPFPGVPITLELTGHTAEQHVQLASATTGEHGTAAPQFRVPDWPDGQYELHIMAETGRTPESITSTIAIKKSWRLMVSTDKPVYQPGQVIHIRSLALRRPDLNPVGGQEALFTVMDSRGNTIYRDRGVTSKFGISSADCALAGEVLEGEYQVECRMGATTGRTTIEVKSYVLPRFKVVLKTNEPYYQPGQTVKGQVQASYVFGKPVVSGAVTLSLQVLEPKPETRETLTLQTDGSGLAPFELRLADHFIGREQDSGDTRVALTATVCDPAGQVQSRTETRIVTNRSIRIAVVPEGGSLVRGLPNTIHLLTSTPDGRPATVRLNVSGLDHEIRTNTLGAAAFELTPQPRNDTVNLTIQASDNEGRTSRRHITLTCGRTTSDYLVRTDRAVYRGGESMHAAILGSGAEPIFLDLIKDGQTILSKTIPIANGRGELEFDLPPELAGTILLCTYRYGPAGLPVQKTRVIQVQAASDLTLDVRPDRPEYKPGERANVVFTLCDQKGQPVPGAISLAAVDEAVFGVLESWPGLERTFFTREQELLKPLYEIESWAPEDLDGSSKGVSSVDRANFQQAVFATTAHGLEDRLQVIRTALGNDSDISDSTLRVLERPDWETLARRIGMPDDVVKLLRQESSPYSMAMTSYPDKAAQTASVQRMALETIGVIWAVLIATALAGFLVWAVLNRSFLTWLVIVGILGVLVGLMLPAVQSAREAGRRAQAVNNLKQIELASAAARSAPRDTGAVGAEAGRIRQNFPETLLWRPELITDNQGRARLDIELADSITTWRLTAGAVSTQGQLGTAQAAIRVFQPFFVDLDLPVSLTRGDEVSVPVVVSNYLDRSQHVTLALLDAPWFERLESAEKSIELKPGEVHASHYRIRARSVGRHTLQVNARSGEGNVADAVRRSIEVIPDGRRIEQVASGSLQSPLDIPLSVPDQAIAGSVQAIVKIYPTSFSQVVEGLDAIFQRPYGCFEQTSSTTYPNVLALDYLQRTGKSVPTVEAKARQYIHLGYQRLLSFEIGGGGFDWFGHPPANRTLTAYGLMEFQDMARVHDVDPILIERTRRWLLDQQQPDGSWEPERHQLHEDPTGTRANATLARLGTTAYIAWAVFASQHVDPKAQAALSYLRSHSPGSISDSYVLALVANALLALDHGGTTAQPYLERLRAQAQQSSDGKLMWWSTSPGRRTMFLGAGESGSSETTALAALANVTSGHDLETTRRALGWLVAHKDGTGTWQSTQATVLALKALLAGTGKPVGDERSRRIAVKLDDRLVCEINIPADQADVLQQLDLSDRISSGLHRLGLEDRGGADSTYQVVFRYHVHEPGKPGNDQASGAPEPLAIRLDYDRTTLAVDDVLNATATVMNRGPQTAPMVILDLPTPAGFVIEPDNLAAALKSQAIAKFQLTPRAVIVYLRDLAPQFPLVLRYRLRAAMPVKLVTPAARVYEYYDPSRHGISPAVSLTVRDKDSP